MQSLESWYSTPSSPLFWNGFPLPFFFLLKAKKREAFKAWSLHCRKTKIQSIHLQWESKMEHCKKELVGEMMDQLQQVFLINLHYNLFSFFFYFFFFFFFKGMYKQFIMDFYSKWLGKTKRRRCSVCPSTSTKPKNTHGTQKKQRKKSSSFFLFLLLQYYNEKLWCWSIVRTIKKIRSSIYAQYFFEECQQWIWKQCLYLVKLIVNNIILYRD